MITSFFDGRVRIRDEALKDGTAMSMVTALVADRDGVTKVTPNTRTGSLLIEYDPEKISRETLLDAGKMLEKQFGKPEKTKKPRKKAARVSSLSSAEESALMGGLYALTALTGFGNKRLHVLLGIVFAVIAGMHVYDRRKNFI